MQVAARSDRGGAKIPVGKPTDTQCQLESEISREREHPDDPPSRGDPGPGAVVYVAGMLRPRILIGLAAALAALGLATSAGASSAVRCWTPSRELVSSDQSLAANALAVTRQGRMAVLWGSYEGVAGGAAAQGYREGVGLLAPASLAFTARTYLPDPGTVSSNGVLATPPSGELIAGWNDSFAQGPAELVWSRLEPGSSRWSAPRPLPTLTTEDASGLVLRALPDGSVRAFWSSNARGSAVSELYGAVLAAHAARWSKAVLLASAPTATPSPPAVAVGPTGELTAVWGSPGAWSWLEQTAGSRGWRSLRSRAKDAAGVALTAGADGTVVASWTDAGAWASVRRPGAHGFSAPQQLTSTSIAASAPPPAVMVGGDGAATLLTVGAQPLSVFRLAAHGVRFARAANSAAPRVAPAALVQLGDGSVLSIGEIGTGSNLELAASRGVPGARAWGAPHVFAAVGRREVSNLIATPAPARGALLGWVTFPPDLAITGATQRLEVATFRATGTCSRDGLPPRGASR
jgi:hypothetical protein